MCIRDRYTRFKKHVRTEALYVVFFFVQSLSKCYWHLIHSKTTNIKEKSDKSTTPPSTGTLNTWQFFTLCVRSFSSHVFDSHTATMHYTKWGKNVINMCHNEMCIRDRSNSCLRPKGPPRESYRKKECYFCIQLRKCLCKFYLVL